MLISSNALSGHFPLALIVKKSCFEEVSPSSYERPPDTSRHLEGDLAGRRCVELDDRKQ